MAGAVNYHRYEADLCRAVASAVVGAPDAVDLVTVGDDRFARLQGREIDILFSGDTHTLEREIREVSEREARWQTSPLATHGVEDQYARFDMSFNLSMAPLIGLHLYASPRPALTSSGGIRTSGPKWC